jgi:hypothetical protein
VTTALFLQSQKLVAERQRMSLRAYWRAQNALYAQASAIAAQPMASSDDAYWKWQWMQRGTQPVSVTRHFRQRDTTYLLGHGLPAGVLARP